MLLAALAALSACASRPQAVLKTPTPVAAFTLPKTGWQAIVTSEDDQRVAHLPATWADALAASKRYSKQIAREGDLLQPGAARNYPAPPPGSYRCRLVKIGVAQGREPAFQAFPEYFCHVRGDRAGALFFTKQTGTELPGGWLHEDGERRLVLTGAKQHGVNDAPLVYGSEPNRDLVGVVERIGPFRWRLVLPWRGPREGLDIYELTPVPIEQQAAEPAPMDGATRQ
ncbi:DUF4893 domain-containing protein [Sphingobium nicotianae]|uniref:DUF4893 domain-containing protein n=1 Tax=Sphingobium nicotianae TaxID=2782607 RepID=A0A9X1IT65_9SPHN|nr:DUF4893 domain-containing protein [Sphingobium nicotianae]MBT2188985.1 DUF4893 domain-containing protein [Sphingobium nicotianae]